MQIKLPISVVGFETDFFGVVSNTRYLEYLERGRYALIRAAGLRIEKIWAEQGVQPIVRRAEIEYLNMAKHEEDLELTVTVAEHSGATSILTYELRRVSDDALLLTARHTLAYLNTKWKPVRVPAIFREALPVEPSPS